MTASDIVSLVSSRCSHRPGEYIEPLIDGHRTTVRISRVVPLPSGNVVYFCRDRGGDLHAVYIADDPRPADAELIAEFNA